MKNNDEVIATAKMTAKGQVTIPKTVREKLEIDKGDSLVFYFGENNDVKVSNIKNCKVQLADNTKQVGIEKRDNNE